MCAATPPLPRRGNRFGPTTRSNPGPPTWYARCVFSLDPTFHPRNLLQCWTMRLKSALGVVWIAALLNGAYLLAFGDPTLAYFLNIILHLVLGVALIVLVALAWRR